MTKQKEKQTLIILSIFHKTVHTSSISIIATQQHIIDVMCVYDDGIKAQSVAADGRWSSYIRDIASGQQAGRFFFLLFLAL